MRVIEGVEVLAIEGGVFKAAGGLVILVVGIGAEGLQAEMLLPIRSVNRILKEIFFILLPSRLSHSHINKQIVESKISVVRPDITNPINLTFNISPPPTVSRVSLTRLYCCLASTPSQIYV